MASERLFRRTKRGVWYGWFYDEQMNRVRFSTHCRSKRAAEAVLSKAEQGAFGVGAGVRGYTLSEAFEQLVSQGCIDKSVATAEMYERKAGHLLRLLGETRRLGSLSMDAVSQYIAARQQEGAQSGTIYKELVTLRRALKLARQNGKYRLDPSAVIPPFRNRYQPRERWMTEEEFSALLKELSPPRRLWILVAVFAGPRLSELQNAHWEDVDFDGGWMLLRGTKTQRSRRRVPLAPVLVEALTAVKQDAGPLVEEWGSVRRDLGAACARAKITRVTPNDLRRTFASWLKQAGQDSLVVARLMGHTSTRMVELVYGHLSSKEYRAAVAVLPRLGAAPTPAPAPSCGAASTRDCRNSEVLICLSRSAILCRVLAALLAGNRSRWRDGHSWLSRERPFESRDQRRQVRGHDLPELVKVHVEVGVNQTVAGARDGAPWDQGKALSDLGRNPLGCLADDLHEPRHRQRQLKVAVEILSALSAGEADGLLGGIEHVLEPNSVIMLRHTEPGPRQRRGRGNTDLARRASAGPPCAQVAPRVRLAGRRMRTPGHVQARTPRVRPHR